MNKEAQNMEVIYKAKQDHDINCPWGGEGKRVRMAPFDIDRMGWEEGDVIAGLVIVADPKRQTMMILVECDAEPNAFVDQAEKISENKDLVTA